MTDIEALAYSTKAEAVLHDRINILPALDIPLAAVSLNRCINEVAAIANQEALDGASTGNELPHDWTKVAEAMRNAEKEIREAVLPEVANE